MSHLRESGTATALRGAHALFQRGRFADAAAGYLHVVELAPGEVQAWCMLGTSLAILGHAEDAEVALRAALARQPSHPDALSNLGRLLLDTGRSDEALEISRRAVQASPSHFGARTNLGAALLAHGRLAEAEREVRHAIELDPRASVAHELLGIVLLRAGILEPAVHSLEAALERDPSSAPAWNNLGLALHDLGRLQDAEHAYRTALSLDPGHAEAHANLGTTHLALGRQAEAVSEFEAARSGDPDNLNALSRLVALKKIGPDSPDFGRLVARVSQDRLSTGDAMLAHFALGRGYVAAGRHGEAFDQYRQAHHARALHHGHRYDAGFFDGVLDRVRGTLDSRFFLDRSDWGLEDGTPIFVVGMPRSGTSLIEQILASHSRVHGAGELRDLPDAARRLTGELGPAPEVGGRPLPDFTAVDRDEAREVGRAYLRSLRALRGGATRVVDKMPHNFEHLWLIGLLFPGATVLHAVRSPLDTCLSCYFQNFTRGHAYTDDLSSLGHQYRHYRSLMEHWRSVLPVTIHDVVYEELVTDPDAGIPALVEACGLELEAACFEFHRTERAVRTASVTQVRKPAYTSSVGRWVRYRGQLSPLIDALGPVAGAS